MENTNIETKPNMESANIETVYFHALCPDGLYAAWLYNLIVPTAKFIPLEHSCKYKLVQSGVVTFIDMVPTLDKCKELLENKEITQINIYDHHIANKHTVSTLMDKPHVTCIFSDNTECASRIIYNKFHAGRERLGMFADYVDDRDRWIWEHRGSKEVSAYMFSVLYVPKHEEDPSFAFEKWGMLYAHSVATLDYMIEEGAKLIEAQNLAVTDMVNKSQPATFNVGDKSYRIRHYETRLYRSEVGSEIMKKYADTVDFAICWHYDIKKDEYWLSMRSDDNHTDVSGVCRLLGGNGHRNAAGCSFAGKDNFSVYFR